MRNGDFDLIYTIFNDSSIDRQKQFINIKFMLAFEMIFNNEI